MILNETMNEIADAIREKKGTTEKIAPINFAEEIKSISAGGGESGGGSWKYYDVSGVDVNMKPNIIRMVFSYITVIKGSNDIISSVGAIDSMISDWGEVKAAAVDFNSPIRTTETGFQTSTVEGLLNAMGGNPDEMLASMGLIEITKDEFLNKTFE